jgi:hypothetical protein
MAKIKTLAKGLGWFSVGLGALELVAPGTIERMLGIGSRKTLLRSYGVRELAAGIGLLTQSKSAPWLWARVAGDAVDLTSLALAFRSPDRKVAGITTALASVAGITALDTYAALSA